MQTRSRSLSTFDTIATRAHGVRHLHAFTHFTQSHTHRHRHACNKIFMLPNVKRLKYCAPVANAHASYILCNSLTGILAITTDTPSAFSFVLLFFIPHPIGFLMRLRTLAIHCTTQCVPKHYVRSEHYFTTGGIFTRTLKRALIEQREHFELFIDDIDVPIVCYVPAAAAPPAAQFAFTSIFIHCSALYRAYIRKTIMQCTHIRI